MILKGSMKFLRQTSVIGIGLQTIIKVKAQQEPVVIGQWLSNKFQMLGPAYIKIGQFIASRKDIFGEQMSASFSVLQDKVQPVSLPETISKELLISSDILIDEFPIASASIGQVHKARDANGNEFVVKIKRPNIEHVIKDDFDFLKSLCNVLSVLRLPNAEHSVNLLGEIEESLLSELDFIKEANNMYDFHEMYSSIYTGVVQIPKVYTRLSSSNYIVMQYVPDMKLPNDTDKSYVARTLMGFFIEQLLDHGLVHGDPHKGNIGFDETSNLILYDFGNVLQFSKSERFYLKELILCLILGNKESIIELLQKLDVIVVDKEQLCEYIDKYIEYIKTVDINVFREHHKENIVLPVKFTGKIFRLLRVYGTVTSILSSIDRV
jgi:predicted unusual protein kinase regulating ubiquinone biosynthesis (AarF/ABC1/UbiB family)